MARIKRPSLRKKIFRGRSLAYRDFLINLLKSENLIKMGLSGIDVEVKKIDGLLKKFQINKRKIGRAQKDYEPFVKKLCRIKGSLRFQLDLRTALFIRKCLESKQKRQCALRFDLYSILAVAIWGAFETYFIMLFEELYRRKPELLKSGELVTYEEAIAHCNDVVSYLTQKQIERMGHFTPKEMLKYVADRVNFCFSDSKEKRLYELYLIRNIIAHNMGIVQASFRDKLPPSVTVKGNRLRITKVFLDSMLDIIKKCGRDVEKHMMKKFSW